MLKFRTSIGAALCLAGAIGAFAGTAQAAPDDKVRVRYYDIRGLSGGDIDRELARKGPVVDGKRALASAAIALRQNIQLGAKGRGCGVVRATVAIKADVTLPRWKDRPRGGRALRSQWDGFAAFAAAHEAQHVAIARRYADRIERTLLALRPSGDCGAVSARAKKAADKLLAEYVRAQAKFDADEQKRLGRVVHGGGRYAGAR